MSVATVGRWGKNLAVRFPNEIADELGLREGDRLEIDTNGDQIVIRRPKPEHTLEEMFSGKSPEQWRAMYAGSYDWGPDVGRETIEE
jgi:antitoxin MazE